MKTVRNICLLRKVAHVFLMLSVLAESNIKDLGSFGDSHIDDKDLPESFSIMTVCSDLHADIDPGAICSSLSYIFP